MRAAATYRIAQVALSTPGLQELWPAIHQIVGELMPATNFYIALYDPAANLLTFPYFVDEVDKEESLVAARDSVRYVFWCSG